MSELRIERRRDPDAVDRLLRSLPEWFGIEAAIEHYVEVAATKQSYLAVGPDERVLGAALVEERTEASSELYLIAVDPAEHGRGVGTALVAAVEADLRAAGLQLMEVHTVGPSYPDEHYVATRAFYRSCGFLPVHEFEGIEWDGPTLVLVKPL